MKACETHLVECLNNDQRYPTAFASYHESGRHPENILHIDNSDFSSGGFKNWIVVDFNSSIKLNKYQIYAKNEIAWIYNWKTEVSKDLNSWVFVDEHITTTCQNLPIFDVSPIISFRYFRISSTGNSYLSNKQNIAIIYIKFYGSYSLKNCNLMNYKFHYQLYFDQKYIHLFLFVFQK